MWAIGCALAALAIVMTFVDTGNLCRLCCDGIGCVAQYDDINRFGFHCLCAGDAAGGGGIELAV
jgi:hypothetical protein